MAAVAKSGLVLLRVTQERTNSTTFSHFARDLADCLKASREENYSKVVWFMDNARYHTSKLTISNLKKEGVNILFNAPALPELNCCELFIRALKQKLRPLRHTER